MKTKSGDQIAKVLKRSDLALREMEWAQRRVKELIRNADRQHEELIKMQRDIEIIKKRDSTMPPDWSARATCEPPNYYQ